MEALLRAEGLERRRGIFTERTSSPCHAEWKTSDRFPLALSGPAVEQRWLERAPRVQKASTELVSHLRKASLGGLEASSGSPRVSEHPLHTLSTLTEVLTPVHSVQRLQ